MQSSKFFRASIAALVGFAGTWVAQPIVAQTPEASTLDEIVVTARRREENLQDVALSVSVISAKEIERLGINSVEDVARLDSSVIFDNGYGATDTRISIRGLSPTRGRATVAVLVDGIDTSSESIAFAGGSLLGTNRLLDIARVEVVKGPQSALYGRSAFAGAIQYVTKDPSKTFESNVKGEFSQYGRYELGGGFSGPVSDSFGYRINGTYWNNDGVHNNSITGNKVDFGKGWGIALTGKWQATDNIDVKPRFEYTDDKYGPGASAMLRHNLTLNRPTDGTTCVASTRGGVPFTGRGCPAGSNTARVYAGTFGAFPGGNSVIAFRGAVPGADQLRVVLDPNTLTGSDFPGSKRKISRASLVANWQLEKGTITSLTGYTDAKFSFDQDGDFDSAIVNGVDPTAFGGRAARFDYSNKTKQFSEELRFQSKFDSPINFTVGGLYWNEKVDQVQRSINIFCLPALPMNGFGPNTNFQPIPAACGNFSANQVLGQLTAIPRDAARDIDHKSAYGLVEFKFANIWKLTAEARYSDEKEKILGVNCSPTLNLPANAVFPGSPFTPCNDPSILFNSVFGPSVNLLYPYFGTDRFFAPPGAIPPTPGVGVKQAPGVPVSLSSSHKFTTPRLSLEVKPTDRILLYINAAKGVKPGGISTVTAGGWQDVDFDGKYDEFTFKDEKLTAYELGAKMTLLDGRLRFNPAIFQQDYKDKQVGAQLVTPNGTAVGRLINAGKARIRGLDLDLAWQATEYLGFGLNYTYLDAKFQDFQFGSTSPTDASRFGSCPRVSGDEATLCKFNLAGNHVERAPENSVSLAANFSHPMELSTGSGGRWFIEGDLQAQSKRYLDIWNTTWLRSSVLANFRAGVSGDHWEALVYVNNAFNSDTVTSANSSPGDVDQALFDPTNFSPADTIAATLPDPRIVGVRFNYRFGGSK